MLQHEAKPGCTVVVGKSGSGKTTFALRYAVAQQSLTCRFLFDGPKMDMGDRTGLVCAETLEELECAVEDGFVLFDSSKMFPGNRTAAFEWYCRWSYDRSLTLRGRKLLLVDEVWKYCSPHSIPQPLAEWIQDGRKYGMETMFCTQRPNKLNEAITGEATELVCFRVQGRNALATIQELGASPSEASDLPLGCFVALNVESGGELRGRLW